MYNIEKDLHGILGHIPDLIYGLIDSPFIELIKSCALDMKMMLSRIQRVFSEYTIHDIGHSVRIMDKMALLTDLNKLNEFERTVLALSALLHDCGMVVEEYEEQDIFESREYKSYYPQKFGNNALSVFVRVNHGIRAKNFILTKYENTFKTPSNANQVGMNFTRMLGAICEVHQGDLGKLKQLDTSAKYAGYSINPQYCAILLRIGDALDIDSSRTPEFLYDLIQPRGISAEHWKKHMLIRDIAIEPSKKYINQKQISIDGECDNPDVHLVLLDEIKKTSEEIVYCIALSTNFTNHSFNILPFIECNVETVNFEISDLTFQIDYHAITNLLSGEQLYGDKKHGLREIIQNSIDACRLYKQMLSENNVPLDMRVDIIIGEKTVIVRDNGIGMDMKIIKDYFLSIGKSYYLSPDYFFLMNNAFPRAISHYGIGFLACFMLSDSITVRTKHYLEGKGYELNLKKNSRFICLKDISIVSVGTEIEVNLEDFKQAFTSKQKQDIKQNIMEYLVDTFFIDDVNIFIDGIKVHHRTINSLQHQKPNLDVQLPLSPYLNGMTADVLISSAWLKTDRWNDFWKSTRTFTGYPRDGLYLYTSSELVEINETNSKELMLYLPSDRYVAMRYKENSKNVFYEVIFSYDNNLYGADNLNYRNESDLVIKVFMEQLGVDVTNVDDIQSGYISFERPIEMAGHRADDYSYLRGIRVDLKWRPAFFAFNDNFRIETVLLTNIDIPSIYPTSSRNTLFNKDHEEIGYAISKAFIMCLREHLSDEKDKELLSKFKERFYSKPSLYINNDINRTVNPI